MITCLGTDDIIHLGRSSIWIKKGKNIKDIALSSLTEWKGLFFYLVSALLQIWLRYGSCLYKAWVHDSNENNSFIHSFYNYWLSSYYFLGIDLDTREIAINKTDKNSHAHVHVQAGNWP